VLDRALLSLTNQDIMLVAGSFVTAELFLRALAQFQARSREFLIDA